MQSHVHYLPLTPGPFSILVLIAIGLLILIQFRILRYAYMRLGVSSGTAFLLLMGSLIGSYFNIPLTVLPSGSNGSAEVVEFFVTRERQATFRPGPGSARLRPATTTAKRRSSGRRGSGRGPTS